VFKSLLKLFTGQSGSASARGSSNSTVVSSTGSGSLKDLENFVDYVVRALVDNPELVKVTSESGDDVKVIKIDCKKEDIGKIVGKHGKTIMAIRALVSGAAGRLREKVSVEVVD
jgi:hypothetical protein